MGALLTRMPPSAARALKGGRRPAAAVLGMVGYDAELVTVVGVEEEPTVAEGDSFDLSGLDLEGGVRRQKTERLYNQAASIRQK